MSLTTSLLPCLYSNDGVRPKSVSLSFLAFLLLFGFESGGVGWVIKIMLAGGGEGGTGWLWSLSQKQENHPHWFYSQHISIFFSLIFPPPSFSLSSMYLLYRTHLLHICLSKSGSRRSCYTTTDLANPASQSGASYYRCIPKQSKCMHGRNSK